MLRCDFCGPTWGPGSERQLCESPRPRLLGEAERLPTIRWLSRMGQCELSFLRSGGPAATKMAFVDSASDGTISLSVQGAENEKQSEGCHSRRRCHEDKNRVVLCCVLSSASIVVAGSGRGSKNRHRRWTPRLRPAMLLQPLLLQSLLCLSVPGVRGAAVYYPPPAYAAPGQAQIYIPPASPAPQQYYYPAPAGSPTQALPAPPAPQTFAPAPAPLPAPPTAPMPPAAPPAPAPQSTGTN